jgi:hypothetical protein
MKNYNLSQIQPLLAAAKSALITIPQISIDSVGAALALGLALKKKGLQVKVFSPQKPDNNYQKLSGLDLITDTLSLSDLVVSLDYPVDQIDQVSYNDDGGHLNLVIKTKPGAPKIDNRQILINNESAVADICFILGDEAGLAAYNTLVNKGNWIFISPASVAKSWAKASLVDPDAPYSEIFSFLLPMLGLELDADSGKNLLIGLRVATQSFSVNVSPETFEAGALCLRATQPPEPAPAAAPATPPAASPTAPPRTPLENVEKSGHLIPGTNKPNPTPTP